MTTTLLPNEVIVAHIVPRLTDLGALVHASATCRAWREACAPHIERRQTAIIDALPRRFFLTFTNVSCGAPTRVSALLVRRRADGRHRDDARAPPIRWTCDPMSSSPPRVVSCKSVATLTEFATRVASVHCDTPSHVYLLARYVPQSPYITPIGVADGIYDDDDKMLRQWSSSDGVDGVDAVTIVTTSQSHRRYIDRYCRAHGVTMRYDNDDTTAQRWSRLLDSLDDMLTEWCAHHLQPVVRMMETMWMHVDAWFVDAVVGAIRRQRYQQQRETTTTTTSGNLKRKRNILS